MHRSLLTTLALILSLLLSGCALFQTRPAPSRSDVQREMREQSERPRTLDYPGDQSAERGDDDRDDAHDHDDHDD
ncbi:MAG TPA: hypothetical protein VK013_02030 [Myxococcaceae bacterium]|nr:hypothetical protein [Myxococcaceae bacterium]